MSSSDDAVRAREGLVSIVSHDLRNPLGSITTSSAMLRRMIGAADAAPDKMARYLDLIDRAADRMNRWINDLIDLARLAAGALDLERAPHAAGALVDETVEKFQKLAADKRIELVADADEATVRGDRTRILQVLANLVGNAIKFTPDGGRVEVAAAPIDDEVRFSVRDTGPGVSAAQAPHVFDRYWQRRGSRGVGLGLSLAKALVQAHGGRIGVEDTPGGGATFVFTLPSN